MTVPFLPPSWDESSEPVRLIGKMETTAFAVDPRRVANDFCPRSEELAAQVDGRLSLEEQRLVQEHLVRCHRCWTTYREVLAVRALG